MYPEIINMAKILKIVLHVKKERNHMWDIKKAHLFYLMLKLVDLKDLSIYNSRLIIIFKKYWIQLINKIISNMVIGLLFKINTQKINMI
jgi:hypothetical protein